MLFPSYEDCCCPLHVCSMSASMTEAQPSMYIPPSAAHLHYDKVPEAINFRALAQKIQLKILESKDAISIIRCDMTSFDSSFLS